MQDMRGFSPDFQSDLDRLMRWRRDVRRFRTTPVDEAVLARCLDTIRLAPSVGLSEPWRVLRIEDPALRQAAINNFRAANANALAGYDGDRAETYATLKLSGMAEAPVQLAVYCDEGTDKGAGLGAGTMPEMRRYSVVAAITQFWLAARAAGLGVGWVSILDPEKLSRDLNTPPDWALVAWLCVGLPEMDSDTPELQHAGWEDRSDSLYIEVR